MSDLPDLNGLLVPARPEPGPARCAAVLDVMPCHLRPGDSVREHEWVRDIAARRLRCSRCKATVKATVNASDIASAMAS